MNKANAVMTMFEMVREFYTGQNIEKDLPKTYKPLHKTRQALRDALFLEEWRELYNAKLKYSSSHTEADDLEAIIEIYDAYIDMIYIAIGTMIEQGIYPKKEEHSNYANCFNIYEKDSAFADFMLNPNNSQNFYCVLGRISYELMTFLPDISHANKLQCLFDGFEEVQKSNMEKRVNGEWIYNEYGKIIKPEGWQAPNLREIILKYFTNFETIIQ